MNVAILILIANTTCTFAMIGLIWIIQLVHYPSFTYVEEDTFAAFSAFHQAQITIVVLPLMIIELATSIALIAYRPEMVPAWMAVTGLLLVAGIWLSTFLIQVPLHTILTEAKDSGTIQRLVATNWIRTIAWTLKGALAVWALVLCSNGGNT